VHREKRHFDMVPVVGRYPMTTRSHVTQTCIDAWLGGRRHNRRGRIAAYWACIALVAMTLFAIPLGTSPGPVYRPFISIAATVWPLADLMTAMLLISQFRVNGRRFLTFSRRQTS